MELVYTCAEIPRLATLARTLSKAVTDIVHYGLVFMTVIIIYATIGEVMFG
jgi:hypothetical protein